MGAPAAARRSARFKRRLPAELDDDAFGSLHVDDVHHVLERERLEIETVGGVVIGRDGLRVAVNMIVSKFASLKAKAAWQQQ
jgi:hypothetical protein